MDKIVEESRLAPRSGPEPVQEQAPAAVAACVVVSASAAETRRLGRCLGRLLRPGDLVLLSGPFGAGKTLLTKGIALGMGIREQVTSPSFTLVNQYRRPDRRGAALYHVDLYRIGSPGEAFDFGLDEYLGGEAVCVIEWPEQVRQALPPERLEIELAFLGSSGRTLRLKGFGARYAAVVEQFARRCAPATMGEGGG